MRQNTTIKREFLSKSNKSATNLKQTNAVAIHAHLLQCTQVTRHYTIQPSDRNCETQNF